MATLDQSHAVQHSLAFFYVFGADVFAGELIRTCGLPYIKGLFAFYNSIVLVLQRTSTRIANSNMAYQDTISHHGTLSFPKSFVLPNLLAPYQSVFEIKKSPFQEYVGKVCREWFAG